ALPSTSGRIAGCVLGHPRHFERKIITDLDVRWCCIFRSDLFWRLCALDKNKEWDRITGLSSNISGASSDSVTANGRPCRPDALPRSARSTCGAERCGGTHLACDSLPTSRDS